jgi:hypothetical protein
MSKMASNLIQLQTLPRGALVEHILAMLAAELIGGA